MARFAQFPSLQFDKRGRTWFVRHRDRTFPLILSARDVYYGTGRLLVRLSLDRQDEGSAEATRILTSTVDLQTAIQRTRFAKEANERLGRAAGSEIDLTIAITTMLDAMEERLTEARLEIEEIALFDVPVPDDLTPKYIVWPFVPQARPGMLVAPAGSGKSSLAGLIAVSCISGKELLEGVEPRFPGPVIYIGQEEDALQMRVRVAMLLRGHQLDDAILKHLHYVKLPGASLVDAAERVAEIAALRKAVMVVVDSAQATWGSEKQEGVRDYASAWFNAVELIEVPALIVEHPNAIGSKKDDGLGWAAGTTVKRDRAGHVWGVKSTEIPVKDNAPRRYHVTLVDSKRNYVARQPNINYEVLVHGYEWTKFHVAGELDATAVVDGNRMFGAVLAMMRDDKEHEEGEGWPVAELMKRLKYRDDRRLRFELNAENWRTDPRNEAVEAKFHLIEGTGGKGNPARYVFETRIKPAEQIEMSMAPVDPDDPIH